MTFEKIILAAHQTAISDEIQQGSLPYFDMTELLKGLIMM